MQIWRRAENESKGVTNRRRIILLANYAPEPTVTDNIRIFSYFLTFYNYGSSFLLMSWKCNNLVRS